MVLLAADAVEGASASQARREELGRQRAVAAQALLRQRERALAAQADGDAWAAAWCSAATAAGLDAGIAVAAAEGALAVMTAIDGQLDAMREIRHARIEAMQADLSEFAHEAAALVRAVAPALAALGAGDAVAELASLRAAALDARKESERLRKEVAAHEAEALAAEARVGRAQAALAPLLHLADARSADALRPLIARSDRRRQLDVAAASALQAVEEGGDGLAMDALDAEIAAIDAAQIPLAMAELGRQIETLRQEQEALTAELTHAAAQLAGIAGQDAAARAESERQDALAKMAQAAERYLKVHTASRLLKWAIDRYRETRQGPMLTRAGAIFSALTLGSFQKLSVDFDSEPLALHGLRADGTQVGVAALSEGTRDQLYLALRLAALELHLGQGQALPFIADDLFINYDDQRARAGLEALARLSEQTQVIFLSHHDHLLPAVRAVFGAEVNVVGL
jgi:uncharacterized protein YhaN